MNSRASVSHASAGGGDKLEAAHRLLLHTRGLQLHFGRVDKPPPTPEWLKALGRFLLELAPLFKYLFWGLLAVGVAVVLYFIGRELWRTRFARFHRKPKAKPADDGWRPEAGQARALLHDADSLAEAGRFDEAVHLLLFRSIEELSGRKPGAVRPALTSRDIAGIAAMPPKARGAFAHIADVVERSFFGGRSLGRAEFTDCRAAYERFAFAEGWA